MKKKSVDKRLIYITKSEVHFVGYLYFRESYIIFPSGTRHYSKLHSCQPASLQGPTSLLSGRYWWSFLQVEPNILVSLLSRISKQEMQRTCNVTLRCVRIILVVVKQNSIKYYECVCVYIYYCLNLLEPRGFFTYHQV